jgi:hypothetical protein
VQPFGLCKIGDDAVDDLLELADESHECIRLGAQLVGRCAVCAEVSGNVIETLPFSVRHPIEWGL